MTVEALVLAAASALVCSAAAAAVRRRERATPLTLRLSQFLQELVKENTISARREKGPDRAIEVGKLHTLLGFFRPLIRDRTAYFLTSNILVPLTEPTRLSYAEFVGPRQVEWFVSHYWGSPFEHFCMALQKHAESVRGERAWEELRYWVCFCSNNQHKIQQELGLGWRESSFYLTLRSGHCRGTCMVLDDDALPLTRIWCIFELMQTVKLERESANFRGLLLCTSSGVLNTGSGSVEVALALAERIMNISMQTAKASSEHDKTMILEQVIEEMGSFDTLNRFVGKAIRDMLLLARKNIDDRFASALRPLEPVLASV